jgi:hypothetical protein
MLVVSCPSCKKLLQVVETATDHESVCPGCGTVFRPSIVRHATSLTHHGAAGALSQREPIDNADSPGEGTAQEPVGKLETTIFVDEWRETVRREQRQRRLVLIVGIAGALSVGLFFLFVLHRTSNFTEAVGATLCSTLFLYLPLILIAYTLPALADLKKGFLKAAGRPTRPSREHKVQYELTDEDLA